MSGLSGDEGRGHFSVRPQGACAERGQGVGRSTHTGVAQRSTRVAVVVMAVPGLCVRCRRQGSQEEVAGAGCQAGGRK